ncbi:MAG: PfkB family carbohydrate kinase [Syntrophobacteraceae bacterium]
MNVDVLCVGNASYDLVLSVDHHPDADEKCFASGFIGAGGGPAANAAVSVARLGGTAAFAGYLGRDHFGDLHFEELRSEGVITDLVARGAHPTPLSSILVKPYGKRAVVTYKSATPVLGPSRVDFSQIRPKAVLFDGHEPKISVPLAKQFLGSDIITVLDAGSVHPGTVALAPLCRYLIASEKFARDFCGENDPVEAAKKLARTAPVAVVTLGAEGLVWRRGGECGRLPSVPVEVVDTTGAGDIFHGAFALRTAMGDDLLPALRYASAAAALGCTRMGARPGIPKKSEVDRLVQRFPALTNAYE